MIVLSARVGFLKMLQEGTLPSLLWKETAPGALEEVGLVKKRLSSHYPESERIELPLVTGNHNEIIGARLLAISLPTSFRKTTQLASSFYSILGQAVHHAMINIDDATEGEH